MDLGGHSDFNRAWQGRFPLLEVPFSAALTIFSGADEIRRDLDTYGDEAAPLAPGLMPFQRKQLVVDEDLSFSARIAKDGMIAKEIEPAQRKSAKLAVHSQEWWFSAT